MVTGARSQSGKRIYYTRILCSDFTAWERAAQAFMTIDTFPKLRTRVFTIGGVDYCLAGMDKGAGMIHPNMGPLGLHLPPRNNYMLFHWAALWAAVSPRSLQSALTYAVDRTFNSISVEMIRFTSRQIGPSLTDSRSTRKKPETLMKSSSAKWVQLTDFATDLAKLVVRDCEGATKFVMVTVKVDPYLFPWRLYLVAGCSL